MIQQTRTETATSYLRRVRATVKEAQNLELPNTDDYSIVDGCLSGFNTHRRYEATVAQLKSQKLMETNNTTDRLTLSKIEALFISIDENAPATEKAYELSERRKQLPRKQTFFQQRDRNFNIFPQYKSRTPIPM